MSVELTEKDYAKAKRKGINRATLQQRMRRGWDLEKAITYPLYGRQERELEEIITPEQYARAERNGINHSRMWSRVHVDMWDVERAMTEPVSSVGSHKRVSKYGEYAKIAEANGIPFKTFSSRISRLGWTIEDASTIPLQRKG